MSRWPSLTLSAQDQLCLPYDGFNCKSDHRGEKKQWGDQDVKQRQ